MPHPRALLLLVFPALLGVAPAQSLPTTFAYDIVGATGWTAFFDLDVRTPISIEGVDVNVNAPTGSLGSVVVHRTALGGSHAGNELGAGWTEVGAGLGTQSALIGTPTTVGLRQPIAFAPGRYGVAITYTGSFSPAYTIGDGTNQSFANADVTLTAGSVMSAAPGSPGMVFSPRVWNGALHYGDFARADSIGTGCGGDAPATFYEQFGAGNPLDLSGTSFAMVFVNGEYYVSRTQSTVITPIGPSLDLSDDETRAVALPWPIPTRTGTTSHVWVCSNGFVSFDSTVANTYLESIGELLGSQPRLCPLWTDLNPRAGGGVFAEIDPTRSGLFHITWLDVPEYGSRASTSTFQVTIDRTGAIECTYGSVAARSCIVGYSHGQGARDPGPVDLGAPELSLRTGSDLPHVELHALTRPVLGTAAELETREIPATSGAGLLLVGFGGSERGVDLSTLGMHGCHLYAAGPWTLDFIPTGTTARHRLPIGNDPALATLEVWLQSIVVEPGANALALLTSNAVRWRVDRR